MTDAPIVVGLAGVAGSGKTTVANAIAPLVQTTKFDEVERDPIQWTHLYFALPLYRMATARQKIQGDNARSRQCYEVHDALVDIFRGSIEYDALVDLTYEVMAIEIEPEGIKPRSFLQYVGTELCRGIDSAVWVKWMDRKIRQEFLLHQQAQDRQEETNPDHVPKRLGIVISDCRFIDECSYIHEHPLGILVRFDVSAEVAADRISYRDGVTFTAEQAAHSSERGLEKVPLSWFDAIINTDFLSIAQQVHATKSIIYPTSNMYNTLENL